LGSLPRSEREHNFLPKLSVKVTSVVFEREIWNFDADLTHVFMDSCTHIYIYIYKSPEGGLEGRRKGGREREAVGEGGKGCPLPLSLPLRSSLPRVPSLGTACKPTGPGSDLFPATYPQHFSPSVFMCQRSPLQPFVHPFPPLPPPPSFPSFPPPPLSFSLGHAPPSFPCSQQCRQALDSLVARFYSDAVEARETPEVKYCASMLQYLDARLERAGDAAQRREEEKLARVAAGEEGGGLREGGDWKGSVGHLLGLMCGHNASFSEEERARLMYHLSRGWTVESFAGP